MLAALKSRRKNAKSVKKLSIIEKILVASKERRVERCESSTMIRTKRIKKDAKLITSYRPVALKKKQSQRKKKIAQKQVEDRIFKKWVQHRNPNLNRKIDIENHRQRVLRDWFNFLDDDGSGEITRDELGMPLISLGLAPSMIEVDALIATVDQDGSGAIDFAEFEEMLTKESAGPIQKLLQTIQSGELGDPRVTSVRALLTAARRRVICNTLHGFGRPIGNNNSTYLSKKNLKERKTLQELQKIQEKYFADKEAEEVVAKLKAKQLRREKSRTRKNKKQNKTMNVNMKQETTSTQHPPPPPMSTVGKKKKEKFDEIVNDSNIDTYESELDERMRREVYRIQKENPVKKWLPSLG
jgi:Ca2+-binding EF-hand superfamily protein